MTPTREEIEHAFSLAAGIIEPETRGEARDPDVIAARDAMQALYLLRQWARLSAPMLPPPAPPLKVRPRGKGRPS